MEEKIITKPHKLVLNNRKLGNFTGISDVLSFDENEILLKTEMGMLHVKGKDLHVNRLDLEKGEVDIDGQVDSLTYSQAPGAGRKGMFFGKLLTS